MHTYVDIIDMYIHYLNVLVVSFIDYMYIIGSMVLWIRCVHVLHTAVCLEYKVYVAIIVGALSLECTTHLRSSSLSVAEEGEIKPQKKSVIH